MKRTSKATRGLAEVLGSRYWHEREAQVVLAAWHRSGESASVFARRQGLAPSRLLWWQGRVSAPQAKLRPVFHPVEVVTTRNMATPADPGRVASSSLELMVGDSRRIVIRRGFDPELLMELVRVLEGGSC